MASIADTPRIVAGVAVKTWLFVAQCNNRIYRRGSPRGDVRRGGPHNQHQNRDTGVNGRIGRLDIEQQGFQITRQRERYQQSECDAGPDQYHTLSEYLPEDPEAIGSQGDANADFTRSFTYAIGYDSIDPNTGKRNCDHTERCEDPCLDPTLRARVGDAFVHGLDRGDALIGVDLVD